MQLRRSGSLDRRSASSFGLSSPRAGHPACVGTGRKFWGKRWTLALALAAVASSAAPAAAITIGAPLSNPDSADEGDGVAGTYKVSPLRVADRDGGPPWGLATFRAKPIVVQRHSIDRGCVEVGRVVDGRLGAVTPADVFHPYNPTQGLFTFCAAIPSGAPGFVIGSALQLQPHPPHGTVPPRARPERLHRPRMRS